ncbi:ORF-126 [Teiidae poxvirus 1]|nr:ORF-126 [Teiidae poxvirus 1]
MDAFLIFIVILATTVMCLFFFQAYTIYDNYHNILEFIDTYSGLEYARSLGGLYVDKRIYDPNDSETDSKAKWRCIDYKGNYASASKFGYLTELGNGPLLFTSLNDCVSHNYLKNEINKIWNPCTELGEGSYECNTLKSHL